MYVPSITSTNPTFSENSLKETYAKCHSEEPWPQRGAGRVYGERLEMLSRQQIDRNLNQLGSCKVINVWLTCPGWRCTFTASR